MQWSPLGDHGLFGYSPDEASAFAVAEAVRRQGWAWVEDVVQSYTSVVVFYAAGATDFATARASLDKLDPYVRPQETAGLQHRIPVCYELGPDLDTIARHTGLDREAVIRLHTATEYSVFAIGFCPGFPYLGYLPTELTGMPRLPTPRLEVPAGSVGLTGRQTGIYTEPRPGGWNLVGRTPLELVHVEDGYFPLRTGDRVHFERIDKKEFERLRGERLPLNPRL